MSKEETESLSSMMDSKRKKKKYVYLDKFKAFEIKTAYDIDAVERKLMILYSIVVVQTIFIVILFSRL